MLLKNQHFIQFVLLTFFSLLSTSAIYESQAQSNLLQKFLGEESLTQMITEDKEWVAFPAYSDRESWSRFLPEEAANRYISEGEKFLDYTWPSVTATSYLDYQRKGTRTPYAEIDNQRRRALLALKMAELAEGKGRFIDQIINGVWAYSEQTWWGMSAHLYLQHRDGLPDITDPVIDLRASDIASIMAWVHYFFEKEFDDVNPIINERIRYEIDKRILNPIYSGREHWWQGFDRDFVNNWNTHCNYNLLITVLLMENNPEKRAKGVEIVMKSLDQFINYYNDDGVSDEGPAYWGMAGAKLFDSLELLHAVSNGKIDLSENEKIINIGRYIAKVYIGDEYFVNFSGASPQVRVSPNSIYRYGRYINDSAMEEFAAYLAHRYNWNHTPVWGNPDRILKHWQYKNEILKHTASSPLFQDFWFSDSELAGARDVKGSLMGFYFAAKGGHNAQSHNFNDVGNFILHVNGKPLLIDTGYGTYTQQTFSSERYSIWTMQSEYHNLPVINGHGQQNGREYQARNVRFSADDSTVRFSADIAGAYPREARVKSWERSYTLNRGESFTISDDYVLEEYVEPVSYHFITPAEITKDEGRLLFTYDDVMVEMEFNAQDLEVIIEELAWEDERLDRNWPRGLHRIRFIEQQSATAGQNRFIVTFANE